MLVDRARVHGLTVRGVMGYEGHVYLFADRAERLPRPPRSMAILAMHAAVGGDVISAGATGTYDLNEVATQIQAGVVRGHGHGVRAARAGVRPRAGSRPR